MKYLSLLFLVGCSATNVDVMYGSRDFDNRKEWEQTDQQNEVIGVNFDSSEPDGAGCEIGITLSSDTSSDPMFVNRTVHDTTTEVQELYIGLRKNWMLADRIQVGVGAGISAFRVETDVDLTYAGVPSDSSIGYAPYIQAGSRLWLTDELTAGIVYRQHFLNEDADIFITAPELDSGMLLFTLGWRF